MRSIPWRVQATYLGVIPDKRLNFVAQFTAAIKKAKSSLDQLHPLLGYNSKLNMLTKIQLYKIIIRPPIVYAV